MARDATVLAEGVQQALAQAQAQALGQAQAHPAVGSTAVPVSGAERSEQGVAPVRTGPAAQDPAPVMLVGHSLGGIAAAGLASSPRFTARHHVTHVVTLGAPVARMPVPPTTQVLSLEHTRDPVPRLDGQANPDRATWVTVTRDAHAEGADRASQTHGLDGYVDTAGLVDDATDPSVVGWRASSWAFFDGDSHGEPVIRDYSIRRVPS